MSNPPVFAFYGDSIVSGYARAGSPDYRWSTLLSVRCGAVERNFSADGVGYAALRDSASCATQAGGVFGDEILDRACATYADLLIICMGINDISYMSAGDDAVIAGIDHDFSKLAQAHPDIPVLVTMYYPVSHLSDRSGRLLKYLELAAQKFSFHFSPLMVGALEHDATNFSNDGIHPSARGHVCLAMTMLPIVKRLSTSSKAM